MEAIADEEEVTTENEETATNADAQEPVAIPPEPPADCPEHIRVHYDAIREKEREVDTLEAEYLSLKEQSSEAKKDFEAADKALRRLIARGSDPQKELPFDKTADVAAQNEAWRVAPFTDLGLTAKQNELFESAGVTTIGGIEDLRAKIADGNAEWPKGVGPAKVTDIENRIVDWLDKNRDKFGEADTEADDSEKTALPGIESVSFSSPGRESVTISAEGFAKLADNIKKSGVLKGKSKHKANGKAKAKKKARR